jgi:3-oxoacyl-[acyl-carrier protein] reductase
MDTNVLGLAGRPALVIGGGDGIGRASVLLLARAGADVALADVVEERALKVQQEAEAEGVRALGFIGDVTDEEQARQIVARAVEFHGGRLEVVINMVGLATWGDLFSIDDDAWEHQMLINLRHHLFLGRAAARHMIDNGIAGRMAFVASVSGVYGAPNHAAYGAAKAGVMALVRTMSQEWGPYGIRVNAVAPDLILTPRIRASFAGHENERVATARNEGASLGRMGEPEEIAGPLVFLVSDLASFVTGQTIIADGGVHAAFPHAGVAAQPPAS